MPSNAPDGKGPGGPAGPGDGELEGSPGSIAEAPSEAQLEGSPGSIAEAPAVSDPDDDGFDWGGFALGILGTALGLSPGLMALGKIAFGGPKAAVGVAEDAIGQVIGKAIPGPLGMIAGKIAANYAGDQVEAGMLSGDPSNTSSPDGESLGGGGRSLAALSAQAAPSAARGQPQQQQQPTGLMNIPQFNYQQQAQLQQPAQLQKPDGMFTAPQFAYQQRSINA